MRFARIRLRTAGRTSRHLAECSGTGGRSVLRRGKTSPTERAVILNKTADRIEAHFEELAVAELWDNGKPVRETLAAALPLAVDHFRCFAGCIRAQEGGVSQLDDNTVAYHFHEPQGVAGQIAGCPLHMGDQQYEFWNHTHLLIDGVPGFLPSPSSPPWASSLAPWTEAATAHSPAWNRKANPADTHHDGP